MQCEKPAWEPKDLGSGPDFPLGQDASPLDTSSLVYSIKSTGRLKPEILSVRFLLSPSKPHHVGRPGPLTLLPPVPPPPTPRPCEAMEHLPVGKEGLFSTTL